MNESPEACFDGTMGTLEEIKEACEIIKKGKQIRDNSLIFATLDCLALHGEEIEKIERITGKDVLWSEAPVSFEEFPLLTLDFPKPRNPFVPICIGGSVSTVFFP
jgi:hypothetical protein